MHCPTPLNVRLSHKLVPFRPFTDVMSSNTMIDDKFVRGCLGESCCLATFCSAYGIDYRPSWSEKFSHGQKKITHITYPKTKPSTPDQALPVRPCRACRNDMHSSTVREVGVGQIAMHGVGNFYCYDIVHGVTPPGWSSYAISAFPFLLKKREHAPGPKVHGVCLVH